MFIGHTTGDLAYHTVIVYRHGDSWFAALWNGVTKKDTIESDPFLQRVAPGCFVTVGKSPTEAEANNVAARVRAILEANYRYVWHEGRVGRIDADTVGEISRGSVVRDADIDHQVTICRRCGEQVTDENRDQNSSNPILCDYCGHVTSKDD